jgi:hypothetical protein
MIQFSGQYTFDQFKKAQTAASGLRRPFRWMLLPIAAVILLGVGVPLVKEGMAPAEWLPVLVFLVLGTGVYMFRRMTIRQNFESNRALDRPISGTIDEEGVELVSQYGQSRTPWPVYYQARVSKNMVLLYQSTTQALFLPREFFASDSDWDRFIEIVRTSVKAPPMARRRSVWVLLLWMAIFLTVIMIWNFSQH